MSTEDGSYAPKSPDLSSFFAGGANPASEPQPQNSSAEYSAYQQPAGQPATSYHQPQPHHHTQAFQPEPYTEFSPYTTPAAGRPPSYYPPEQPNHFDQILQPAYGLQAPSHPQPYYAPYPENPPDHFSQPVQSGPLPTAQHPVAYEQPPAPTEQFSAMPPRKSAQLAQQTEIMQSPVKTKFPTARIKRIMQADEEVGKVAQQTPIAVGKALELFMVQIVTKSADVAKEKNSKRISAQMLKQAVATNPQWDFLLDIVSKVSEKEDPSKSGKSKVETESDEEPEPVEVKKKGKGGGRKKKASA